MARLGKYTRDVTSWQKLPIGMNAHLKVYFMLNCALLPRPEELSKRKDSKCQAYRKLLYWYHRTPMWRVYQARKSNNPGRIADGLSPAEARPYARKFIVLGREGLAYISKHGDEPPWFTKAYLSKYGVRPPP